MLLLQKRFVIAISQILTFYYFIGFVVILSYNCYCRLWYIF